MNIAPVLLLALALQTFAASAAEANTDRPLEARRYRSADGVEILTDRASGSLQTAATTQSTAKTTPPERTGSASAPRAVPAAAGASALVSSQLQKQRDDDRSDILWHELNQATRAWQTAQRALNSPRAKIDLSATEQAALSATAERHAQDIKAIHAELQRLRPELAGQASTHKATAR